MLLLLALLCVKTECSIELPYPVDTSFIEILDDELEVLEDNDDEYIDRQLGNESGTLCSGGKGKCKEPVNSKPWFRVVNGTPAIQGELPYQIGFRSRKTKARKFYKTFCGGTLVAATKILSAAHCFFNDKSIISDTTKNSRVDGMYAVAGSLTNEAQLLRQDSPMGEQWRRVRHLAYPSQYKFPDYDICCLTTSHPFKLSWFVRPIPYMREQVDFTGHNCLCSGFGQTSFVQKTHSPKLLRGLVHILSPKMCHQLRIKSPERFICSSDKLSDVARGDSGGPLVCWYGQASRRTQVLVGISSGKALGTPGVSAFFTRVSAYKNFLDPLVKENGGVYSSVSFVCVVVCLVIIV